MVTYISEHDTAREAVHVTIVAISIYAGVSVQRALHGESWERNMFKRSQYCHVCFYTWPGIVGRYENRSQAANQF